VLAQTLGQEPHYFDTPFVDAPVQHLNVSHPVKSGFTGTARIFEYGFWVANSNFCLTL
jgi:hypothetical protein